jgi:tyrosinase
MTFFIDIIANLTIFFFFLQFNPVQAEEAYNYTAKFMTIANENPDDPIEKVLEFAKEATETTDPQLIRWSLMIFITHHPSARNKNLRIPPLVQRSPELSVPKKKKVSMAPGPVISNEESEGDVELFMNWYREDPNLNEHHEHWHLVYYGQGIPDVKNTENRIQKDRHGELFIYMHRQMLARYDAERLGIGLEQVIPFDDNYCAPIKEGYKPNENLVDVKDDYTTFGSREPKSILRDTDEFTIDGMEKSRKKLEKAIEKGEFDGGTKIDINLLGAVVESYELLEKKKLIESYGKLHMAGHLVIAQINDDPGVMYDTRTAARDPVFWRWHRHIDNLINTWEEKQEPNDFSNSPPVNLKDVIFVFKDKLPINYGETQDKEATEFGKQKFGGENFYTDVSNSEYVTDELQTKMKSRTWTHIEDSGLSEEIDYLFPREFYYYFRVENTSSSSFNATFRVFIVPEELAESRRHWIELDKFKETLSPNSNVVCRDCDMSSVVRQPPQKTEDELDDTSLPIDTADKENNPNKTFCDCGWPFHLLIPRGRRGGMKFKLLVFISDWTEDEVPAPSLERCGSISYCGAEKPTDKYPDKKPMGYPLDRPFRNNSYEEVRKENYFEIISWKRN